jgi:hypothetical protein
MPASAKAPDLATWQPHLDFLLPRAATLRTEQIAEAVGVDRRTVERAFEGPARDASGKLVRPWLLGFSINAAGGERFTRRIPRPCAILWIAHCCNYSDPDQFLDAITEAVASRSVPELLVLQQRISALIRRAQA